MYGFHKYQFCSVYDALNTARTALGPSNSNQSTRFATYQDTGHLQFHIYRLITLLLYIYTIYSFFDVAIQPVIIYLFAKSNVIYEL